MPSGMNLDKLQHANLVGFIFVLVQMPATNGFPVWKASGNTVPRCFGGVECSGSGAVSRAKRTNMAFLCAFE